MKKATKYTALLILLIITFGGGYYFGTHNNLKSEQNLAELNNTNSRQKDSSKEITTGFYTQTFVGYLSSSYESLLDLEKILPNYPNIDDRDTKVADYAIMRLGIAFEEISNVTPPEHRVELHNRALEAIITARNSAIDVFLGKTSTDDGVQNIIKARNELDAIYPELQ